MNRKTLQKAINELSKENPSLDYVRGMLETLIETIPEDKSVVLTGMFQEVKPETVDDEAKALEYMAAAKLEAVRQMAGE